MTRRGLSILIGLAIAAAPVSSAAAGVVVLANRTEGRVPFVWIQPDGRQVRRVLDRTEVVPLSTDAGDTTVTVVFDAGGRPRSLALHNYRIYEFRRQGERLELAECPLPGLPASADAAAPTEPAVARDAVCTIPVKILADDKEPTTRRVWEKRYRQRVAAASAIIERYCRVRFEVVAVETWRSQDDARELGPLIAEFERTVKAAPARLAIGFTGQYQSLLGEKHMGGTHGPFRPHILIREWGRQIEEPDRLEMLIHEVGHYLGAVHSAEDWSVMRPDISGGKARARSFHIGFDAPNTLAMYLVGEALRSRGRFPICLGQLPAAGKDRLRSVYRLLTAALPTDPAAPAYLAMLDRSVGLADEPAERVRALIGGARIVVQAVTEAARKNQQLPKEIPSPAEKGQQDKGHGPVEKKATGKGLAAADPQTRLEGDRLSEYYVRRAAAAARQLPPEVARGAFLLGLGVAMDDSALLWDSPVTGAIWRQIESSSERTARLAVLGNPTMQTRHDWAQHFSVSAALVVLVGLQGAEGMGIVKELNDARGGSGFSFADYLADLSGIFFAGAVDGGKLQLSRLQDGFTVADFLPKPDGLKEGIGWDDFVKMYGFPPDRRLSQERELLRRRILALPGHQ
jgi:hypothetical protein